MSSVITGLDGNKLVLILIKKANQSKICEIVSNIQKNNGKICYVCLSKPYAELMSELKEEKVNCDNVLFVDVLSSLHYDLKPVNNCLFVPGPEKFEDLKSAIKKAIISKDCSTVVFDNITTLLIYQQVNDIVKFTHELTTDQKQRMINKVYLMQDYKGFYKEESTKLINDLYLFANKVVEL
jgi:hypothetical protein